MFQETRIFKSFAIPMHSKKILGKIGTCENGMIKIAQVIRAQMEK